MWHVTLWLSAAHHILFLLNPFSVEFGFPFPILHFLPQNYPVLLKDQFLEKMFLKRAKTCRLFSAKLQANIILLLQLKKNLGF